MTTPEFFCWDNTYTEMVNIDSATHNFIKSSQQLNRGLDIFWAWPLRMDHRVFLDWSHQNSEWYQTCNFSFNIQLLSRLFKVSLNERQIIFSFISGNSHLIVHIIQILLNLMWKKNLITDFFFILTRGNVNQPFWQYQG